MSEELKTDDLRRAIDMLEAPKVPPLPDGSFAMFVSSISPEFLSKIEKCELPGDIKIPNGCIYAGTLRNVANPNTHVFERDAKISNGDK